MTKKYNWMNPEDTEIKSCSIRKEEIYGMGNNPQPVILDGKKLEIEDSCCDDCNIKVVVPTRIHSMNLEKYNNLNIRKDLH